ncbi:hypothetical protein DPMN_181033 [Dreissena polymorpha]|uniref:Uncharacterized protein n=1 Tax=Dreissena polymorpha TaxID=45954 RepID=A0A9D4DC20_DREPO|nr:hypothetical protein DPMN_181033 [Dreissena polymorpha]
MKAQGFKQEETHTQGSCRQGQPFRLHKLKYKSSSSDNWSDDRLSGEPTGCLCTPDISASNLRLPPKIL